MDAYILRGLPGSGKSHLAAQLTAAGGEVVCTDDLFMVDGEYRFDGSKLVSHHAETQQMWVALCEARIPVLVCANTNVQRWHMEPYVNAAREHGYRVHFVTVGNPRDEQHQMECGERNLHGVPLNSIIRMGQSFED